MSHRMRPRAAAVLGVFALGAHADPGSQLEEIVVTGREVDLVGEALSASQDVVRQAESGDVCTSHATTAYVSAGFMPHKVVFEIHRKDDPTPETAKYLACGPPMRTAAVNKMLIEFGTGRDRVLLDDFGG